MVDNTDKGRTRERGTCCKHSVLPGLFGNMCQFISAFDCAFKGVN